MQRPNSFTPPGPSLWIAPILKFSRVQSTAYINALPRFKAAIAYNGLSSFGILQTLSSASIPSVNDLSCFMSGDGRHYGSRTFLITLFTSKSRAQMSRSAADRTKRRQCLGCLAVRNHSHCLDYALYNAIKTRFTPPNLQKRSTSIPGNVKCKISMHLSHPSPG